jgi:hypothetical protein
MTAIVTPFYTQKGQDDCRRIRDLSWLFKQLMNRFGTAVDIQSKKDLSQLEKMLGAGKGGCSPRD